MEGLKAYFEQFGQVTECVIMRDPTGRSRCFGFVTFADPSVIDVVLQKTHILDKKQIDPKRAIPKELQQQNPPPVQKLRVREENKVFVGGIHIEADEKDIKEVFGHFDDVVETILMRDRESGRSRGFGFVTFATQEGAQQACNDKDIRIRGRPVEVKMAVPKGKGSSVASTPSKSDSSDPYAAWAEYYKQYPGYYEALIKAYGSPTAMAAAAAAYYSQYYGAAYAGGGNGVGGGGGGSGGGGGGEYGSVNMPTHSYLSPELQAAMQGVLEEYRPIVTASGSTQPPPQQQQQRESPSPSMDGRDRREERGEGRREARPDRERERESRDACRPSKDDREREHERRDARAHYDNYDSYVPEDPRLRNYPPDASTTGPIPTYAPPYAYDYAQYYRENYASPAVPAAATNPVLPASASQSFAGDSYRPDHAGARVPTHSAHSFSGRHARSYHPYSR